MSTPYSPEVVEGLWFGGPDIVQHNSFLRCVALHAAA